MTKTAEDVHNWLDKHNNRRQRIIEDTKADFERRGLEFLHDMIARTEPGKKILYAGSWLTYHLRELGLDEDEVKRINFELGQRSFARDPVAEAVKIYNGVADGDFEVTDKEVLADQINREFFGLGGEEDA